MGAAASHTSAETTMSVAAFSDTALPPNGGYRKNSLSSLHSTPPASLKSLPTSRSEPNFTKYSSALANDNIVIVESPTSNSSATMRESETAASQSIQQQPASVSRRRLEYSKSVTSGVRGDRAGATLRNLSDAELPQPDAVRKAKDVFETMARQQDFPSPLPRSATTPDTKPATNSLSRPRPTTNPINNIMARSQSMLVLTGRAWCNGNGGIHHLTPNLTFQHQHQHGACSNAVRSARHAAFIHNQPDSATIGKSNKHPDNYYQSFANTTSAGNATSDKSSKHPYNFYQPGNSQTLPLPPKHNKGGAAVGNKQRPNYKRSCSDLDRFFSRQNGYDLNDDHHYDEVSIVDDGDFNDQSSDSIKLDDDWGRHLRLDGGHRHGSPVSPEAIRKIREQGTCVTFFGGHAYVEQCDGVAGDDTESLDDDSDVENHRAYMLDYPHDLYTDGSSSPVEMSSPASTNRRSSAERPKIIGVVPKFGKRDGSYCSSVTSSSSSAAGSTSNGGSESVSPAPPTGLNGALSPTSAWFLGGLNPTSLEDLRLSLHPVHHQSRQRDGGGANEYFRRSMSTPGEISYDGRLIVNAHARQRNFRHGQWMKNPYWQGSYYVIFDFTNKDVQANVDAC